MINEPLSKLLDVVSFFRAGRMPASPPGRRPVLPAVVGCLLFLVNRIIEYFINGIHIYSPAQSNSYNFLLFSPHINIGIKKTVYPAGSMVTIFNSCSKSFGNFELLTDWGTFSGQIPATTDIGRHYYA